MVPVLTIMQGDQYAIPFEILLNDGSPADGDSFDDVEVVLGGIRKTVSGGEITFDTEKGVFLFPVTQVETLRLTSSSQTLQIRIKPKGSADVIGVNAGSVSVVRSESKAVL